MRAGLEASVKTHGEEGYQAGSIVLCAGCYKPLYRLDKPIGLGQKVSRSASAYRPMTAKDYADLAKRAQTDRKLEPALAGLWRAWKADEWAAMAQRIPEVKAGDKALCPFCGKSWPHVRAVEAGEVHDHAYTWELLTVPPQKRVPTKAVLAWGDGLELGQNGRWVS